jgi:beta-aspartyl-peptidase (threonine type)
LKRSRPIILVHGGAGRRTLSKRQAFCLQQALIEGHQLLKNDMPAVQAVELAIRMLEGSGLFNAGLGSNRQLDGVQRMDASIMEGGGLRAGAVASIEGIMYPITAARLVMEKTEHVLLVGGPATRFAQYFHAEPQPTAHRRRSRRHRMSVAGAKTLSLFAKMANSRRVVREQTVGKETVGAVALDRAGTVAAGASTGGVDVMLPGRVGDTPLIGCGVYADNQSAAISMTGLGEGIIRIAVAKEIAVLLERGMNPARATLLALNKVKRRTEGLAGAIVLATDGRFSISHLTPRMAAGYWDGRDRPVVADRFR